jgi:hypothetical protein
MSSDSPAPSGHAQTAGKMLHNAVAAVPTVMNSISQMSLALLPKSGIPGVGGGSNAAAGTGAAGETMTKKGPKAEDVRISLLAEFLLKENFHLVALELHQELMERAKGPHNIACLNEFFGDPEKLEAALANEVVESKASSTLAGACRLWGTLLRLSSGAAHALLVAPVAAK